MTTTLPASGSTSWYAWAQTVDLDVRESFNVKDYGAVGNGTTDDTTAVNSAITAANTAGGMVWFPPGTYSVTNLALKANVTYAGVRGTSILKIRTGAAYLATCDSGSPTVFISKMTFTGLTFRGLIDTDTTFDQQRHLLNLNGVTDLLIINCEFIGWHGDAIYLGSSNSVSVERHNQRVKIIGNWFDGLTKNNRNCVSIIDGDDILIQGNSFRRCSAPRTVLPGNPGIIDVEPNGSSTFAITRNVRVIGNHAEDHNNNFFQANLPPSMTANPQGFLIADNTDDPGASNTGTMLVFLAYSRSGVTDTSPRQDVMISGNICRNAGAPVEFEGGVLGVTLLNNTFVDIWGGAVHGYWSNTMRFITWQNNKFIRCGWGEGLVHRIEFASYVAFIGNVFHDCGLTGGTGTLIHFSIGESAATSTNIDFIDNTIIGTKTTVIGALGSSHTLTAVGNLRRGYRNNGLTIPTSIFGTALTN